MNNDCGSKMDRTRSPTRSMMAWKSSCSARASPISLTTASSAARESASTRRRLVSSNRRTFSSAKLDGVLEGDDAGGLVVALDVDAMDVEDFGDLVADQVVHRLAIEPLGKALLDAVDDRQLGGAFVSLGQQPLRFVEEPGVLERHAKAARKRRQEAHV